MLGFSQSKNRFGGYTLGWMVICFGGKVTMMTHYGFFQI